MMEQDPYVTIEEALELTGWSREELFRQIGDGKVQIKFGAQAVQMGRWPWADPEGLKKPEDHPAYQLAENILNKTAAYFETSGFRERFLTRTTTPEDQEQWNLNHEAAAVREQVIKLMKAKKLAHDDA